MTTGDARSAHEAREAAEYLRGLELILRRLHADGLGKETEDALVTELQDIGLAWEPLRYQAGVGQGFNFVADNVRDLIRKTE